ncbi:MAG: DUF2231 domain-containing protein [Kineosporiaceae bacterium]
MFDTVNGLPVHALVVHAVVVLLPLMGILTPLVAWRPTWRASGALPLLIADAAVFVMTFVAKESGEKLQSRLTQAAGKEIAEEHAELGDLLPIFAFALLVAAVLIYLAQRRGGVLVPIALVVAIAAGLAAVGFTIAVGHSGAEAVWKDEIANTPAPAGD